MNVVHCCIHALCTAPYGILNIYGTISVLAWSNNIKTCQSTVTSGEREEAGRGLAYSCENNCVFIDRLDIDLLGVRVLVVKIGLYWITDHTSAQLNNSPNRRHVKLQLVISGVRHNPSTLYIDYFKSWRYNSQYGFLIIRLNKIQRDNSVSAIV